MFLLQGKALQKHFSLCSSPEPCRSNRNTTWIFPLPCTRHCAERSVTTMLTYPWKCTVSHCNHLGNTWKPLVLMTRHFDYCPSASEGDNQSVTSSAPVVSRCFPGGYNVKLYISRGRLAWWLLAFLCSAKPPYRAFSTHKEIIVPRYKIQDGLIAFSCIQLYTYQTLFTYAQYSSLLRDMIHVQTIILK